MKTFNLSNIKQIFVLILAIVVMTTFDSCKKASEKTGEKGDLIVIVMGGDGMVSLSVGTTK